MRQFIPVILLCLGTAAAAQEPAQQQPACTAVAPLPAELAAWTSPAALAASADRNGRAALAIGQAARLTLLPTPQVRYRPSPEKPGGSVSYGGIVAFRVDRAGTYRVALSSGAWIDVVRGGASVTSVAHGRGPDCTGVRKMVDFPLSPGRYQLQIAANGEPAITAMIVGLR